MVTETVCDEYVFKVPNAAEDQEPRTLADGHRNRAATG
jgi:hypothetical protein